MEVKEKEKVTNENTIISTNQNDNKNTIDSINVKENSQEKDLHEV